ncbi:MAG: hypothetical protein AAGF33_17475 [Pseudomonadota bacterium]
MTLETVYFISQIIAALSVIASLVFVGLQIRQNTRATKASAAFDATNSLASLNEELWANYSDERMVEGLGTYDPTKGWEDFSLGVQTRMIMFNRGLFQKMEGAYYLHRYGGLDDDIWEARRAWAAAMIKLPFHATCWEQDKQDGLFSKAFIEVIEAARDTTGVHAFRDIEFETAPRPEQSGEESDA